MDIKKSFSIISVAVTTILALLSSNTMAMDDTQGKQLFNQATNGNASSLQQLQQATQTGDAIAEFWTGVYLEEKKQYPEAITLLQKAAVQRLAEAQNELGFLYYNGQGVVQDYAQAAQWLRKAADQGKSQAQFNLGVLYAHGQGVAQDYAQAAQWYRKAADQGDAAAQYNLGLRYANGQGVAQDYAQAAQWYRKAADQGDTDAQNNLGGLYANGQGVTQDYAQAAQWYRKAADQGDAAAQYNLGLRYDNGQGVAQDYAQAAQWYRKAADQGIADAQNNLGAMYVKGQWVGQDNIIAYALYNLSASKDPSSSNPATKNRDNLVADMSEAQIESAQALTREMDSKGVSVAIDGYVEAHVNVKHKNKKQPKPVNKERQSTRGWPARPAHQSGITSCNTQCVNGDCLRTYDNGRHVHLNVPPSIDPLTSEMKFDTPPC